MEPKSHVCTLRPGSPVSQHETKTLHAVGTSCGIVIWDSRIYIYVHRHKKINNNVVLSQEQQQQTDENKVFTRSLVSPPDELTVQTPAFIVS